MLALILSGCDEPKSKHSKSKPKAEAKEAIAPVGPKDPNRVAVISQKVENFTGAHTRMVWAENQVAGSADSFARSNGLILRGIDTRDGKGERKLLSTPGNYSRPILSSDGETILYTDKNLQRENKLKHYKPVIYRTDWSSGKITRLAEGYAVDCWKDPATGTEWVYATKDLRSTSNVSLEATALVRFPLDAPDKMEVLYKDTIIGPDNIQLSRDGTRASGLFPWPHTGVFRVENGKWTAHKLQVGCWPSMAPDNSGISWVFDGEHRSATFFDRDGVRNWKVRLNTGPNMHNHEVYHPRWSNHPRFLVVSGPYNKEKDSVGSVINKGGASAQIYIAKLTETASDVEGWLQMTGDNLAESYPDLWVEGGEKADLVLPAPALGGTTPAAAPVLKWPTNTEGLLFLWENRDALNSYRSRSGEMQTGRLELQLAAHYGRHNELLLGGGSCTVENAGAAPGLQQLQDKPEASFEALILLDDSVSDQSGNIFRGPHMTVSVSDGLLVVAPDSTVLKGKTLLPTKPYHLAVTKNGNTLAAYVDGQNVELAPDTVSPVPADPSALTFGGDWSGGLLHIALYDHALSQEELATHAQYAAHYLAQLPPAPPRIKLQARLTEVSAMPTPEGIDPYTSALVVYLYEVEKVLEGDFPDKTVLVKHWAMLGQKPVQGFPREMGKSYELVLEKESAQPQLEGERVMDDTTTFDMEPWFDVSSPRVVP